MAELELGLARRALRLCGATTVAVTLTVAGGVTVGAAASVAQSTSAVASATSARAGAHLGYGDFELGPWGGYIATGTVGEFTSVVAYFTVPAATCLRHHDLYAPWVGIDGFGTGTVEQTGLQTACYTGSPVYSAWWEMYPKNPKFYPNPVDAGDAIAASVTASGDVFTLTISDITKGWTRSVTKTQSNADEATAEAVIESPDGLYPDFPGVTFTGVEFNGQPLNHFTGLYRLSVNSGPGTTTYHPTKITHKEDFSLLPR